ncbi:DNA polymerase III subunit delta [bacterium BMS3Abin09]|nr:DNA polymerase III subunit delta [bacterium BMS3Abin09]GBE41028.1 DNA polymerase III subunit delta [bacterium BMS3Bbin09]HDH34633.1 DNA polymerase III subunit delta [Nitrospirota bacterium]
MQNKTLLKEFEKGLPGAIYYLWSEESMFLEESLSKFSGAVLDPDNMDFNYDRFDSSSEPQEILNAASTLPFMAQRRLVVVKDFHQFKAPAVKVLTPYLNEPSESTCMVILSQKAPKKAHNFKWKTFSLNIRENDIPAWLKNAAAGKNLKLTNDAVESLIEFVGYDIGLLMMEVDKLALSGSGTITGKDIAASASMMRTFTPFDLLDSLISGQKTRAFRILKTMFSGSSMEAPVILGTLNWHYKQFYSLWLNKGRRPAKMREKTFRSLKSHLPSFSERHFLHIFKSLHEADLGIKTSGRPELEIEVLLIKLLQKGALN